MVAALNRILNDSGISNLYSTLSSDTIALAYQHRQYIKLIHVHESIDIPHVYDLVEPHTCEVYDINNTVEHS